MIRPGEFMGGLDLSAEGQQRILDIGAHVVSVVTHRALTPAERLHVLMMAAAAVIASNLPASERVRGVQLAGTLLGASVEGAGASVDAALARMPVEGRA